MRKVLILEVTGEVGNIVVLPDQPDPMMTPYTPPDGCILVDDDGTACNGGTWDGVTFQPPPLPPPPTPGPQAELDAAIAAATTLDDLKAALLGTAGSRIVGRQT